MIHHLRETKEGKAMASEKEPVRLPLSDDAREIIHRAHQFAKAHKATELGGYHLLLALLFVSWPPFAEEIMGILKEVADG